LLEVPITSAGSQFSYEPRFGRLGVFVNSTVTFRPAGRPAPDVSIRGRPRDIRSRSGPPQRAHTFHANRLAHFVRDDGYLLAALCVGLIFVGRFAPTLPFALMLAAIEALTLMACVRWTPSAPWFRRSAAP